MGWRLIYGFQPYYISCITINYRKEFVEDGKLIGYNTYERLGRFIGYYSLIIVIPILKKLEV